MEILYMFKWTWAKTIPFLAVFIHIALIFYGVSGVVINFLELPESPIGIWPFNQRPIYLILIYLQFAVALNGFTGILSIYKRSTVFSLFSAFILLIVVVFGLCLGTYSICVSKISIKESIFKGFQSRETQKSFVDWLTKVQWNYKCCGLNSWQDWKILKGNLSEIPETCCVEYEDKLALSNCSFGILSGIKGPIRVDEMGKTPIIYLEGCESKITPIVSSTALRNGIHLLVLAVIALLDAFLLAFCALHIFNIVELEVDETQTVSGENKDTFSNISKKTSPQSHFLYVKDESGNQIPFRLFYKDIAKAGRNGKRIAKFNTAQEKSLIQGTHDLKSVGVGAKLDKKESKSISVYCAKENFKDDSSSIMRVRFSNSTLNKEPICSTPNNNLGKHIKSKEENNNNNNDKLSHYSSLPLVSLPPRYSPWPKIHMHPRRSLIPKRKYQAIKPIPNKTIEESQGHKTSPLQITDQNQAQVAPFSNDTKLSSNNNNINQMQMIKEENLNNNSPPQIPLNIHLSRPIKIKNSLEIIKEEGLLNLVKFTNTNTSLSTENKKRGILKSPVKPPSRVSISISTHPSSRISSPKISRTVSMVSIFGNSPVDI